MLSRSRPAAVAGLVLALSAGCGEHDRTASDRPNVVLVVLDTLRPDRLGAYGHDRGTSPVLDALAEECFVFETRRAVRPGPPRRSSA
jgi:glucan phosphoethanolaminetransferase (alkaline phosphatase superfamily)